MIPVRITGVVTNAAQQMNYPNVTAVLYSGTSPQGRVKRTQSPPTGSFDLTYVPAQIPEGHNLYVVFVDGSGRELLVVSASAELAFPRPPVPTELQPPTVVNVALQPRAPPCPPPIRSAAAPICPPLTTTRPR